MVNLKFLIFTEYLRGNRNKYQIGKKLKIPTSQVCYYFDLFEKLNLPDSLNEEKFQQLGEKLVPLLQEYFGSMKPDQIDFFIQYFYHFTLSEFR